MADKPSVPPATKELPPLTEREKHDAFEWLRELGMRTDSPRHAYVALRAWQETLSPSSAAAFTGSREERRMPWMLRTCATS